VFGLRLQTNEQRDDDLNRLPVASTPLPIRNSTRVVVYLWLNDCVDPAEVATCVVVLFAVSGNFGWKWDWVVQWVRHRARLDARVSLVRARENSARTGR